MQGIAGLLPADVLLKIFSYCSYTDLVRFQFVCRWWQQVSREQHLWRDIVYKPGKSDSSKEIIDNLKVSPELRALNLKDVADSTVTEELVQELVNGCPRLEKLTVSWVSLYEKINSEMKKIKILILEEFYSESGVNFEFLHSNFPNIEHLECSSTPITGRDLHAYLKKKRCSLHTVSFYCKTYESDCILPYLSECTHLKSLTLIEPCVRNGHLPAHSIKHLMQISSLTFRRSFDWDVYGYIQYFRNLVELHLDSHQLHSEQVILFVANNCPLLEKLTLCYLFGSYVDERLKLVSLVDEELKYISNLKKLMFLGLRHNMCISDACVPHLQAILELKHLDIYDCKRLGPQCLPALCSFNKLQTLKFDLQNRVPPDDFSATHVKNPDLHIMFYNCKNTSVLDPLRHQRLRISLLK